MDKRPVVTQAEWKDSLVNSQVKAAQLFGRPEEQQRKLGYFHTLREICQQPWTWLRTGETMAASQNLVQTVLSGMKSIALTGSGSSEYAGDCVRLPLQNELGIGVESISGGSLLIQGAKALPTERPTLLVSLARSGNSPESAGVVKRLLDTEKDCNHLVVTCNEQGMLAREFANKKNVHVITLPPETNDESLVMTSSFTNLLLAARFLGMYKHVEAYKPLCETLSKLGQDVIRMNFDALARVASTDFRRTVYLGSGTRFSATREASLKMLEMTSGHITTMNETFLGFRHGPMSFVHEDTLVVCQLSTDPISRAYELDLLGELDRKKLGLSKVIIGENIPESVVRYGDEVIQCPGLSGLGDDESAIVYVVVAQLLAFFRCMEEGLQPDSPSESGVINRVVENFPLHTAS